MPRIAYIATHHRENYVRKGMLALADYAQNNPGWEWDFWITHEADFEAIKARGYDGVLAAAGTLEDLAAVKALGIPAIHIYTVRGEYFLNFDDYQAGRLAAEHLAAGKRHLATLGSLHPDESTWLIRRARGMCDWARERGLPVAMYPEAKIRPIAKWNSKLPRWEPDEHLIEWVSSLPKPVGILGGNIYYSRLLLHTCKVAGVRVPEEASIISPENDPLLCEIEKPTLSAVELQPDKLMLAAAKALDDWITTGRPPQNWRPFFPVGGIVIRQSTRRGSGTNPLLSKALRFLSRNLAHSITVHGVAQHCGVARRTLELCFRREMSTSPKEELLRLRVMRARELLMEPETRYSLAQVAEKTGLGNVYNFSRAFKRMVGIPPGVYRDRGGV